MGGASSGSGRCTGQAVETDQSTRRIVKKSLHTHHKTWPRSKYAARQSSKDGRLLPVKPLAREVGAPCLRDLEDERSLDIPVADINAQSSPDQRKKTHLAASTTAFAVHLELTFYQSSSNPFRSQTSHETDL